MKKVVKWNNFWTTNKNYTADANNEIRNHIANIKIVAIFIFSEFQKRYSRWLLAFVKAQFDLSECTLSGIGLVINTNKLNM
jgi:hypothetical protein